MIKNPSVILTKNKVKDIISKICIDKYHMQQYCNTLEFSKKIGNRFVVVSATDVFLEYPFFSKYACPAKQLLDIIYEYDEKIHKLEIKISKAPIRKSKQDKLKLKELKHKLKTQREENKFYKKCLKFYRIIHGEVSTELKKYSFIETSLNEHCKYHNLCRALTSRHVLIIEFKFR